MPIKIRIELIIWNEYSFSFKIITLNNTEKRGIKCVKISPRVAPIASMPLFQNKYASHEGNIIKYKKPNIEDKLKIDWTNDNSNL